MKVQFTITKLPQAPSVIDFHESDKVDPTHGWIPFVFVLGIVPIILVSTIIVGYFILW